MKTEKLKRLYKVRVNYTREGKNNTKQYKDKFYLELPDNVAKKDVCHTINDIVGNGLKDDVMVFRVTYYRVKNALRFVKEDSEPNYIGYGGGKGVEDKIKPPLYWSELSNVEMAAIIKYNKELIKDEDNDFVEINHKRFVEGAYVRCGNYIRKITKVVYSAYGVLDLTVFWDDGIESGHGEADCSYKHYTMI